MQADQLSKRGTVNEVSKDGLLYNFLHVTALFSLFYILVSYIIDFKPGMVIMAANFVLLMTDSGLFKLRKISYRFASNFYVANCFFCAVLGCSYFSGGLYSPVAPWFVLIPTISLLLLGGGRDTTIWLFVVCAVALVYAAHPFLDREFPVEYNIEHYKGFFFASCWIGLILIIYLVSFLFESAKNKAFTVIEDQNLELLEKQDEITASNEELMQQKEEIESLLETMQKQNDLIRRSSDEVKASITYASRIQNALMPFEERVSNYFDHHFFTLFRPRDVVSGDFFWCEKVNDTIVLAVGDCTGHGVPGAFMSMLGIAGLNSIVFQELVLAPGQILNRLHEYIFEALKQGSRNNADGMDIVVLTINTNTRQIRFAGAMNPIYYILNEEIFEIKGDKKPIGSSWYGQGRDYTTHDLHFEQTVCIYLSTDGFQDQFGGDRFNKTKFMKKRFKALLLDNHQLDFAEQNTLLECAIDDWMERGDERQIDDILVVGLRI